jgi:hypothetical protein
MPDLTFRIGADIKPLQKAISQARSEISRGLGSIGGIGGILTGAGIAAGLQKVVGDHVQHAKEIAKLAQLANSSVAEASKLLATGEQFGVTEDKIAVAMQHLSKAASGQPELFKAIGVATEDASGNSRRAIDIFGDVRKVLSEGGNDYRTTAAAVALLGKSVEDIFPMLRASEAQIQAVAEQAAALGLVMSEEDVKATLAFAGSMKVAEAQGSALARMLATSLIPTLGDAAEAAMTAWDVLGALRNTANDKSAVKDWAVIGGLSNLITNSIDALAGTPSESLRKVNEQVNAKAKLRADFAKLAGANLLGAGGGLELPRMGSGSGRDPVAEALHDRIDAIKDEAREREQATRDALKAFDREKTAAIDAITVEKDARRKAHDEQIQQLHDVMDIEDAAYRLRTRARDDETTALRAQLDATAALESMEQRRLDVAAAERGLRHEKGVTIFRERGETEEQYQRRAFEQSKKLKDAEKTLSDAKKALARDEAKAVIEARIRAIETESKADARLMEDKRSQSDERIKAIQRQSDLEQTAYQARIDRMQAELKAEQQRVADLLEAESRKTDGIVAELEKQLKEHIRIAGQVGAAWDWATRPRTITVTYAGSGPPGGGDSSTITPFAGGGEGVITSPTLLVNARTGVPFASVAEHGPESFAFGRRGGAGMSSTVNVYGLTQDEAVAAVARRVDRNLEQKIRARASAGFGR